MINLGIIFGGKSYEHDISIITAYQLRKKLELNYNIFLIYITIDGKIYDASRMLLDDFKHQKYKRLKKLKLKKMHLQIIVGAMHGENGEDGLAYSFARLNNIKYFGCDLFAGSLCLDKYKSYQFLAANGIKMLDTEFYCYKDYLSGKKLEKFPCIVKPLSGGSSLGIVVIKDASELEQLLVKAFSYSEELIVEPYYENIEEYNLALSEEDYSNLERINKKDDIFSFDNKYSDSFKVMHQSIDSNARLYKKFCKVGRKVYDLIGAKGIIRIDFFLINNEIIVNEVNTTPGALAMYLFDDFIKVFNKSIALCFTRNEKSFYTSNFLLKNDIKK